MEKWDACAFPVDPEELEGRVCYEMCIRDSNTYTHIKYDDAKDEVLKMAGSR